MSKTAKYEEGFYHLYGNGESAPVLVYAYPSALLNDEIVFGFNTHDGGGFIRSTDLDDDVELVKVDITEVV